MASLQDALRRYKDESRARQTPEVREALRASVERTRGQNPLSNVIKAGERFRAFTLPDAEGDMVALDRSLSRGPVILTFYRGLWCPYCNLELEALASSYADITKRGAELYALSPQSSASSRATAKRMHLPFRILNDRGNEVASSAGLRYRLDQTSIELYTALGVDLPRFNDEPSWTLPIPARIVIGEDGTVLAVNADADYTTRPEPSETVALLDALLSERRSL